MLTCPIKGLFLREHMKTKWIIKGRDYTEITYLLKTLFCGNKLKTKERNFFTFPLTFKKRCYLDYFKAIWPVFTCVLKMFSNSRIDTIWKKTSLKCLRVKGRGGFLAVSTCFPEMKEMDLVCSSSTLPPVTSKTSGVTYANIFCAVCNYDYDLQYWNVEYRCEQQNIPKDLSSSKWRPQDHGQITISQKKRHCEYYSQNNDFTLLDSLELRPCILTAEIFRCSLTWRNLSVSQLCESYSDPVYVNGKLYKNLHCAECNYEILTSAKCQPAIVETLLATGMTAAEILQLCKEEEFEDCLNYIHDAGRGKRIPLRFIFNIHGKMCFPEPNKICCEGEKYDPRSGLCRPFIPGNPLTS
ncbi:uncharacterized protein LOC118183923 [Stegodyphus dumicola]|uniref:uncharacterized protein LOC118183923 n=1 Tax=Stegodyphus dumicola TaxID=202533 RepID=UPI0015B294DC|nr:uncharacterized protein LOC118183923 [Stegodyphus dumicola]